jgi:hypothetical protein
MGYGNFESSSTDPQLYPIRESPIYSLPYTAQSSYPTSTVDSMTQAFAQANLQESQSDTPHITTNDPSTREELFDPRK